MDYKDVRDLVPKINAPADFQKFAGCCMSAHFGTPLTGLIIPGFPKRWDYVSSDHRIIGDAKYLSLVRRIADPPAKLMEIAGHVFLLERTQAVVRFLVFGNQREVPELWLRKYGSLPRSVDFYFLDDHGQLVQLR